jgi:hypothetical protein
MKRPDQSRRQFERRMATVLSGRFSASEFNVPAAKSAPLAVWSQLGASSSSVDNFFTVLHNSKKKLVGNRFQGTRHSKKEGEQYGRRFSRDGLARDGGAEHS